MTRSLPGVLRFGPFRLLPAERRLTKDGAAVRIGDRALDLLVALASRPGEVIDGRELMSLVWPGVQVGLANLRVNVRTLRVALGPAPDGSDYVRNVHGRGYCFAATALVEPAAPPARPREVRAYGLPPPPGSLIGRGDGMAEVASSLAEGRLVSLIGPGGIGKTTLAVAVAHQRLAAGAGDVCFVDLGALNSPDQVLGAIASLLGVRSGGDQTSNLVSFLQERRALLVLDSCEHLIEPAARLAERCLGESADIAVLVTSREPLRAEGERVHRLASLDYPRAEGALSAEAALRYPAVQLLVERAAAAQNDFALMDDDAPLAAELCRRLDGVALAIELAAGRIGVLGLRETTALLDGQMGLRWPGRRTAVPRHQTLEATLDWSHSILPEVERVVFRRLSMLVGSFPMRAACAVAGDVALSAGDVQEAVVGLIGKSLVAAESGTPDAPLRLLDVTRAYARAKLVEAGEQDATARRHAIFVRECLDEANAAPSDRAARAALGLWIGNIRAALDWSFSPEGDVDLAVDLAAKAAPVLLDLTLWAECEHWTGIALASPPADEQPRRRLDLLLAHAQALQMDGLIHLVEGQDARVRSTYEAAADLAGELGETLLQARALLGLHRYFGRNEDFAASLEVARRMQAIAEASLAGETRVLANLAAGISRHFMGPQDEAVRLMRAGLTQAPTVDQMRTPLSVGWATNPTSICLARSLWLSGYPDQATAAARDCARLAEEMKLAGALGATAIWTIQVYFWVGDWASARAMTDDFLALSRYAPDSPSRALGLALQGELMVRTGEIDAGLPLLCGYVERLRAVGRYSLMPMIAMIEGMMALGERDEPARLLDEAIALSGKHSHLLYMPELLRLSGELAAADRPDLAEARFRRSLALAEDQAARSWTLRTATSLARLETRLGEGDAERRRLGEALAGFTEGFSTQDLVAARTLASAFAPPPQAVQNQPRPGAAARRARV